MRDGWMMEGCCHAVFVVLRLGAPDCVGGSVQ